MPGFLSGRKIVEVRFENMYSFTHNDLQVRAIITKDVNIDPMDIVSSDTMPPYYLASLTQSAINELRAMTGVVVKVC